MPTAKSRLKDVADQINKQFWNPYSPPGPSSPLPSGYPAGGYVGGIAINVRTDWVPQLPQSQSDYNLNADFATSGTPDGAATPANLAVTAGGSGTQYYYGVSQVSNFTESIPSPSVGPVASTGAQLTWSQGEAALSTYKVRRSTDGINWQTWCSGQFTCTAVTGNTFTVSGAGWTPNQWVGYWCTILNNTRFQTLAIQITSNTATTITLATTWQPSSGTTTVPPNPTVFCISQALTTGSWTDTGAYTWTTLPDFPSSYRHDSTTHITNFRILLEARVRLGTSDYDTLIAKLRPIVYQEWWQSTSYKSWMYFDLLELDRLDPKQGWGNAAAFMAASVYLNSYHSGAGYLINTGSYNFGAPHSGDPAFYRSYTLPDFGWNWQGAYDPTKVYAYPEAVQAPDGANWWAITSVPLSTPPPVNEIQTVTINGVSLVGGTGGTYTFTFNGQTTAAITYNSTPAEIENALNAISSIGTKGVTVTTPGGVRASNGVPATIEFTGGAFANQAQPLITATSSLNGAAPTITIVETAAGENNVGYWRSMPNYRFDYVWESTSMLADAAARFDGYDVKSIKQGGFSHWTLRAADLNKAVDLLVKYLVANFHPATGLPATQLDFCYPGVPGSGFIDPTSNSSTNGGQIGQILFAMVTVQRLRPNSSLLAAIHKMTNVALGAQKFNYRGAWAPSTSYNAYDLVSNGDIQYTTNPAYYVAPAGFTSGASFNAANWVPWVGVVYVGGWTTGMTVVQYQTLVSLSGTVYMRTGASGTSTDQPGTTGNWFAISWYPVSAAGTLLLWDPTNGGVWGSMPWDGSYDHNGSIPADAGGSTGYKETGRQLQILRGLTLLSLLEPAGADVNGKAWTAWRDQYLGYALGPFWYVAPSGIGGGYLFRQAGDYTVYVDTNTPKLGFGTGGVPANSYNWIGKYDPTVTYNPNDGVLAVLADGKSYGAFAAGGTGGGPAAGQDPVNFPTLWTTVPPPVYLGEAFATSEAMGIGGTALAEYLMYTGT
jgi:hypothetical protein